MSPDDSLSSWLSDEIWTSNYSDNYYYYPAEKKVPRTYVEKKKAPPPKPLIRNGVMITPDHSEIYHGTNAYTRNAEKSLSTMMKQPPRNTGILPAVVRSFSPDMKQWLVERTPFRTHLTWRDKLNTGDTMEWEINIPWTLYYIILNDSYQIVSVSMFALAGQIFADDDPLYQIPLPNIYRGGEICFGEADVHSQMQALGNDPQLSSVLSIAINAYWSSSYNSDLEDWQYATPEGLGGSDEFYRGGYMNEMLDDWAQLSMEDVLKLRWRESTAKLPDLLYKNLVTTEYPQTAQALADYLGFVGMKQ